MLPFSHRLVIAALCCLTTATAYGQANTQRGAAAGGLTGAIAGGLIGDHNGEAGAGAAIGGVIGAVTGGLLGNAADKEAQYRRQQLTNQQYQQQLAYRQSAVSPGDVVSMTRSGLSPTVIINQINQRGVQAKLQVSDIIALHEQGVGEEVISAMQRAPTGPTQVARMHQGYPSVQPRAVVPAPPVAQPVIVEEHYILPHYAPRRSYYYRRPPFHHHHHHHGIHIQF